MKIKKLFSTEDHLAIWIGLFMLAAVSLVHFSQYPYIKEQQNSIKASQLTEKEKDEALSEIKSTDYSLPSRVMGLVNIPRKWDYNPIDSVYVPQTGFAIAVHIVILFFILLLLFGGGDKMMGGDFRKFFKGFALVFALGVLAFIISKQKGSNLIGANYAIWALLIGIIISNTIGTPKWAMPGVRSEYYIKTGLVILGAEILLSKVLAIGIPGIFVAWVVTPIVLVTTYIFGQKVLKLKSKSLNMTICADMSVCGVSAAIATAAATKAKKEELTIAITLSMIFTVIMMVVLPLIANLLGLPEVLAGAWIGGTLDSTGAVVAAGKFVGDKALQVAATIKMIQNVLIGIIVFFIAIYWTLKVERDPNAPKPKASDILSRFPKFLIGFLGASVIFSIIYSLLDSYTAASIIDNGIIKGFTKNIKDWLFCIAFVSIGLQTNFKEFKQHVQGHKHIVLYCCGQLFNILLTLGMAYVMFYLVFPEITAKI